MKKVCSICMAILMISLLSGCTTKYPETNTVYITKNGAVEEASVEQFDKDYYNKDDLEKYINSEIETFEKENEKGLVKMKDFKLEGKTAKLMMKFEDYKAYTAFNERELFAGNVLQALAAGYTFDTDFYAVEDGKVTGESLNTNNSTENLSSTENLISTESLSSTEIQKPQYATVGKDKVTSDEEYKVVVLNEDTDVQIHGDIIYVSSNVTVKDDDLATVKELNEEVSYIVYK